MILMLDFKSRKISLIEWLEQEGWKGSPWLVQTVSYPRAGLTVPRSVSGQISILTPPKSKALCPSHSLSYFFTRSIISDFFSCPIKRPLLQFKPKPSCLIHQGHGKQIILFPHSAVFLYIWILWTFPVLQIRWDLFLPPQSTSEPTQRCSKR